VEALVLTGSTTVDGTGNSLANSLTGNGADNLLSGKAGADSLIGGAGNDTYIVDDAGDSVVELSGQGSDSVRSNRTYSLGAYVERLTLSGTAAIDGTGNYLANRLTGNAAANALAGWAGADTIDGGLGNDSLAGGNGDDSLVGGLGNDRLTGGAGADRLTLVSPAQGIDDFADFASGSDRIVVTSANFGDLPVGTLDASRLVAAGTPLASGDAVFLYDVDGGSLSFDADGNGAGAAIQIATLTGPKTLLAGDIEVVAA
jgi:Ca2+-binding RTX toxin-like protein